MGMNLCKLIWGKKIRSREVIRLLKRECKDRRQWWREKTAFKMQRESLFLQSGADLLDYALRIVKLSPTSAA